MTAKDHNKLLGIFFAINAGLQAFGILVCVLIYGGLGAAMISSHRDQDRFVGMIFLGMIVVVLLLSFVFLIPQALAAFKLLKNRSGARFWAIFAAIVVLLGFPLGTALGVYALWFLFSDQGKSFYQTGEGLNNYSPPPPPNSWQ